MFRISQRTCNRPTCDHSKRCAMLASKIEGWAESWLQSSLSLVQLNDLRCGWLCAVGAEISQIGQIPLLCLWVFRTFSSGPALGDTIWASVPFISMTPDCCSFNSSEAALLHSLNIPASAYVNCVWIVRDTLTREPKFADNEITPANTCDNKMQARDSSVSIPCLKWILARKISSENGRQQVNSRHPYPLQTLK